MISEALTAAMKQYVNSEFDLTLPIAKGALGVSTTLDRVAALAHMPPVSNRYLPPLRLAAANLLMEQDPDDAWPGDNTHAIRLAAEALRALVAHVHAKSTSTHPVDIAVLPFTTTWQFGSVHPSLEGYLSVSSASNKENASLRQKRVRELAQLSQCDPDGFRQLVANGPLPDGVAPEVMASLRMFRRATHERILAPVLAGLLQPHYRPPASVTDKKDRQVSIGIAREIMAGTEIGVAAIVALRKGGVPLPPIPEIRL